MFGFFILCCCYFWFGKGCVFGGLSWKLSYSGCGGKGGGLFVVVMIFVFLMFGVGVEVGLVYVGWWFLGILVEELGLG